MKSLLCLGLVAVAQLQAGDLSVEEKIKAIRTRYNQIEKNLGHCRQVKRDLPDESTEGGELTAYFSGQSLRKMSAKFYGETGRALEEFYFWQDRLIFVLRVESRYDKPLSGVVRSKSEERFYFDDGVLIRWLDPGKEQMSGTARPELRQLGEDWLVRARKYSTLAKEKKR
jgi:hypothetical protein